MAERSPAIAVVGAGAAGLTAAHELIGRGASVVVYEAEQTVGGRMRTDRVDGYAIDTGAQLFASTYTRLFGLAERLGIRDRLIRTPGRDALWRGGRAHEVVYGSVTSMLASGAVPFRTKVRLGTTYVPFLAAHSSALDLHAPERAGTAGLDGESIGTWGARELGEDFVEHLVYPQLTTLYGSLPEETSAALYHILARQGVEVSVHALRGGAGGLCDALAERVRQAGGELRLGSRVERVELDRSMARVFAEAGDQEYDGVVVAVPAPVAHALLPGAAPALLSWLGGIRFRPSLVVALLLDRPVGARFFGLAFGRTEARVAAAVCVEDAKGADLVPPGRGLVVVFVRPDHVEGMLGRDARAVVDAVMPDVVRAFPGLERHVTRARVYRWKHGYPLVEPGYFAKLARFRDGSLEGDAPLALAGDYLYTPSVEGAITSGEEAARRLWRRLRAR